MLDPWSWEGYVVTPRRREMTNVRRVTFLEERGPELRRGRSPKHRIIIIIIYWLMFLCTTRATRIAQSVQWPCFGRGSLGLELRYYQEIFSSPKRPDGLWGLTSLLFSWYRGFLSGLPITPILPVTSPSITCFTMQFLRKMWPIWLALLLLLYALHSSPPWLYIIILLFSHDRSNWSSPSLSSTTFRTFPCFI